MTDRVRFHRLALASLPVGLVFTAAESAVSFSHHPASPPGVFWSPVLFFCGAVIYTVWLAAAAWVGAVVGRKAATWPEGRRPRWTGASAAGGWLAALGPLLVTLVHSAIRGRISGLWLSLAYVVFAAGALAAASAVCGSADRVLMGLGDVVSRALWLPGRLLGRRGMLAAALAGLTILCLVLVIRHLCDSRANPGGSNVLLVTVDTLRWDKVSCYGSDVQTPGIDRIAATGVRFENAVTQCPWTTPSIGTVLTGTYPSTHRCGWPVRLPGGHVQYGSLRPDVPTLARILQAHGYDSQAIITNNFLSPVFGLADGFDGYFVFGDATYVDDQLWMRAVSATTGFSTCLLTPWGVLRPDKMEESASFLSDRALRWMGKRTRPFFLWLHYIDPHEYLSYRKLHTARLTDQALANRAKLWGHATTELSRNECRRIETWYDGNVAYCDRAIKRLIDGMESQHLDRNTLVIFTSDHGEEFWEHGGYSHGHAHWEEIDHVPMLMRFPAGLADHYGGKTICERVGLIDIAPTVLAFLGLPAERGMSGRNLLPLIAGTQNGEAWERRPLFSEALNMDRVEEERVAFWLGTRKMILPRGSGRSQLYDLSTDPGESNDLAGRMLGSVRGMQAIAHRWMRDHTQQGSQPFAAISPRLRKRLKALGYLH